MWVTVRGWNGETAKPEGCCRETCAPHFPYKVNHPPGLHCLCSPNVFLPQHTGRLLWLIPTHTLWVGSYTVTTWQRWRQVLPSQHGRPGFNPWVRKIPWKREWVATPVFLPGEFHEQRSLAGYSPRGRKELDITEQLTLSHLHMQRNKP